MIISELNLSVIASSVLLMPEEGTINKQTFDFLDHEKKGMIDQLKLFRNNDNLLNVDD